MEVGFLVYSTTFQTTFYGRFVNCVPTLFSSALFLEQIQLEDAKGAKALTPKYTGTILILSIPEAVIDLDTPEDYEQLLYIL
ncbi:hypothetical protein [Nostoc sp.]|uniref:hypothetical protein n=1 Tax=Nostoc sp. TaxID=1180 RepID=UPI002FF6B29B